MLLAPILLVLLSFERYLGSLKAGEDTILNRQTHYFTADLL